MEKRQPVAYFSCGHETQKNRQPLEGEERGNRMGLIILIVLILLLVGVLPTWPHSRNWGYYPSSGLGLVVLIILILVILGRI
jgi:hypothetical protein